MFVVEAPKFGDWSWILGGLIAILFTKITEFPQLLICAEVRRTTVASRAISDCVIASQ